MSKRVLQIINVYIYIYIYILLSYCPGLKLGYQGDTPPSILGLLVPLDHQMWHSSCINVGNRSFCWHELLVPIIPIPIGSMGLVCLPTFTI